MTDNILITILMEDTKTNPSFLAEHGLAFWIEFNGKKILFDTGQSDNLIHNARTLNIDLKEADAIIISHGHYDHTGGLPSVLAIADKASIYLHPSALKQKFSQKPSHVNMIGMSDEAKQALERRNVIWTEKPTVIFPGITATGQIPRVSNYEDTGGAFYTDIDCRNPDPIPDDQSLYIETDKGLIVVLGCAHSGVVNILDYITQLTHNKHIYAVIGGMHLLHAGTKRINKTIRIFKDYNIDKIIPLHCTGQAAVDMIKQGLGEKCTISGAGGQFTF